MQVRGRDKQGNEQTGEEKNRQIDEQQKKKSRDNQLINTSDKKQLGRENVSTRAVGSA